MTYRILIADDDSMLQEMLKAALEDRGYVIDVAGDGLSALRLLKSGHYDLALVDYHLPEIDGLASARVLNEVLDDANRPRLIAVTADTAGLEQRVGSEEVFDTIVRKPFDIRPFLQMIDQRLNALGNKRAAQASAAVWAEHGLPRRPRAAVVPHPTLRQRALLEAYFDVTDSPTPDLVIVAEEKGAAEAVAVRTRRDAATLPIVDLTGMLGHSADAVFQPSNMETWRNVATTITRFNSRRARLASTVALAQDLETQLLAYVFVSARELQPTFDPSRRSCVVFPGFFPEDRVGDAAERLVRQGLLSKRFVDRFHACVSCHSHRLNVREECPSCRSPDLTEVSIIHHFRCAHQAVETKFIQGPNLICPKCRQHLRHYGSDYDRPGHALVCNACGVSNSEPAVGFACLDCGAHMNGDAVSRRDVFAYALTDAAVTRLTTPATFPATAGRTASAAVPAAVVAPASPVRKPETLHATAKPPDRPEPAQASAKPAAGAEAQRVKLDRNAIPEALRDEVSRLVAEGALAMTAIAEIRYDARDQIIKQRGEGIFRALRRLFLENLANALVESGEVFAGHDADFALLPGVTPEEFAAAAPKLLEGCQELLAQPVGPSVRLVDPQDLAAA